MEDEPLCTSLFPPSLDDGEGPARTLTARETEALAAAAVRACGLSITEATRYRWSIAPELSLRQGKVRDSRSHLNNKMATAEVSGPSGALAEPARHSGVRRITVLGSRVTSPGPTSKRGLRAAIVVAVVASSTAAAAVTTAWGPLAGEWQERWAKLWEGLTPAQTEPVETVEASEGPLEPIESTRQERAELERSVPVAVDGAATMEISATKARAGSAAPKEDGAPLWPPLPTALVASVPARPLASAHFASALPAAPPEEDSLSVANALRAELRFDEAAEKYLEVVSKHPGSTQALVARVAAATLKLEQQQDPVGARELLIAVTALGSPSIPEAEFLLTRTYQALGDLVREREALRRFVLRYPDHPLVPRAQRRLESQPDAPVP